MSANEYLIDASTRRQVLRHTSKLDTGEMKLFMDWVYAWALDKGLPLTIPEGCQYDELSKRENVIE